MACKLPVVEFRIIGDYSDDVPLLECPLEILKDYDDDDINWELVLLPEKANTLSLVLFNIKNFIHTDFSVLVDDEEFLCHLLILRCYSEFFYKFDGTITQVQLDSEKCSPAVFHFVYEWMLNDSPYEDFSRENLLDVFDAAKYLKIKQLEEQCWSLIDNPEVFNEETAFKLYIDARQRNMPEICEIMLPRIKNFFLLLVGSKEWLELECSDIQAFLGSNLIRVNNEVEVFMSAIRWLKHDWRNREKHVIDILDFVRFGNMPGWQLVHFKRNSKNEEFSEFTRNPSVLKLIENGMVNFIVKNWHGGDVSHYDRYAHSLGIVPVRERNWTGEEINHFSYREFLMHLNTLFKKYTTFSNISYYAP